MALSRARPLKERYAFMGDLPNFPQGKGCIVPALFLVALAVVLIGGLIAFGHALSFAPAFN